MTQAEQVIEDAIDKVLAMRKQALSSIYSTNGEDEALALIIIKLLEARNIARQLS